jgi:arginyl-tRNA synthetase
LQELLKQALTMTGHPGEADHSVHFAYEMVALTHRTARTLGYDVAMDEAKPFVEVSGRKGLGVKADDLIDQLIERAAHEVASRNPEIPADDRHRVASAIAIAAVRYFLIKFTRGKVIAFDIDDALSFEGETGPYIQYAAVRAANILAKLAERDGLREDAVVAALPATARDAIETGDDADELWGLVLEAARLDDVVDVAVRSLELSVVAKFAFTLGQAFNAFYHRQPILREDRTDVRMWRAAAVVYVRRQLTLALGLMGCDVPVRM